MDPLQKREALFLKINRAFRTLYYVFCLALIAVYALRRDAYHLVISLGTPFVPPAIGLFYKIFRGRRVQQLDFLMLSFAFLAYPLGACLDFYRILPGFDKLAHSLSGVFVSLLCLIMYYYLKPEHDISARDASLAMAFVFFGSMAVAGLWEIGEYLLSFLVGLDLQRAAATGVTDSMHDMIVCLIGTVATLPFVRRLALGRQDLLTGAVNAFVQMNLKG